MWKTQIFIFNINLLFEIRMKVFKWLRIKLKLKNIPI